MNFTKNQLIIAGVTGLVVVVAILILTGAIPGLRSRGPEEITAELAVWNVGDGERALATAFAEFKAKYRNVTFSYRSFPDEASYEAALLDALAAGVGPDILALRNDKLLRHGNKLAASPAGLFSLAELRARFPQVVEKDFTSRGALYALPLSIDTLALFYNRDLLDTAGIAEPPATWDDVQRAAPVLTKKGAAENAPQSGIALGGRAGEIPSAPEILTLLMLQTGTKMTDDTFTRAEFDSAEGLNALRFYLQFGNPAAPSYAWIPSAGGGQQDARSRFADEKLAMMIDFASAIPALAARNSFLNYAVAPAPQPKGATAAISYPSYYGLAVSRRSRQANLAWEFVKAAATSETAARSYAETTGKPPALRLLATAYGNDSVKNAFARQILTARSWAQTDPDQIRAVFAELIDAAVANPTKAATALGIAADKVTNIMTRN